MNSGDNNEKNDSRQGRNGKILRTTNDLPDNPTNHAYSEEKSRKKCDNGAPLHGNRQKINLNQPTDFHVLDELPRYDKNGQKSDLAENQPGKKQGPNTIGFDGLCEKNRQNERKKEDENRKNAPRKLEEKFQPFLAVQEPKITGKRP